MNDNKKISPYAGTADMVRSSICAWFELGAKQALEAKTAAPAKGKVKLSKKRVQRLR